MKRLLSYGLALLAAGILALSSCKDDLSIDIGLSDRITFAVENTVGENKSYVRSRFYAPCPRDSVRELQLLVSEDADSLLLSVAESPEFVSNDRWNAGTFVTTRGSLATLSSSTEFGVSASVYPSSGSYSSYGLGNYFHDKKCTPNTALEYYWPSPSNKISFHAYYPYGNSYFTMSSDAMANGYPVYSYSVPSDIDQQVDVMTASVVDNACTIPHGPVTLQFKHNCASVRFKFNNTGADPITVKSISLEGIKYSGTLQNGTWTLNSSLNSSSVNPFSLTLNTAVSAGATADLTGTENIFIMLPQTLSGSSVLKIVTAEKTYSTVLSGEWLAGKTYTYTVKMDESWSYYLDVSGTADFAYSGGTNNYTVKSYKQSVGGTQQAVAWTASFSTDGGSTWSSTAPSWLTAFTASGSGGTSASSYTATVAAQSSTSGSNVTATSVLRSATVVSDYDLSTHTVSGASCSMTTANCYLVHAAGTYKLPLVYGNAIKNGVTNTTAYAPSGSSNSDTFLTPFLNHNNSGITDPWLKNNSATPNGAKLIWQDVNGLITNVGISGDYLTFTTASQSNISEGNAVIAATKDGVVVWSWHIWVTPETFSTLTSIAGSSYTYKVTPVNLGWVNIGNISWTSYEARSFTVKISQLGGQEKTLVVTQNPSMMVTASRAGVNTYYQWGRKDPEISAASYNSNTIHAAYDISGSSVSLTYSGTSVAIGTSIQNPLIDYSGPYSTYQYNLWDANNTSTGRIKTKTVKTIYDPCPAGFCVPTSDLFYVMTGGATNYSGTWDSTNKGRLWTDGTTYFPATGKRIGSSGIVNSGYYGNYWSTSPNGSNNAITLYPYWEAWGWDSNYRTYGYSMRSVLEE